MTPTAQRPLTEPHTPRTAARPLPYLPDAPSGPQLEEWMEALIERTPRREQTVGWFVETLTALPLPAPPPAPRPYVDPLERHGLLLHKQDTVRAMLAWLTQDAVESGYWKRGDVRQCLSDAAKAVDALLDALEVESWRECGDGSLEAEAAVETMYADVRRRQGRPTL